MNPSQNFPYTANRDQFLTSAGAFGFIVVVEGLVVVLLVTLFAQGAARWALYGAQALLYLWVFAKLFGALWTSHRLTPTHLHLRYGIDLRAALPREALVAARPVREKVQPLQATSARYDAPKQRLDITFSEQGQVLLTLAEPRPFRVGLRGGGVADTVLFNVDDRDALLAALALPETDVERGALSVERPAARTTAGHDGRRATALTPLPARAPTNGRGSADGTQPAQAAICAEGLTRRFGDFVAVDGLNLAIAPGEIYGFLGANGAGKTTTLRMLVGLLEPSAGRAALAGHDMWAEPLLAKAALGYVPDRAILYERLSGREFLHFLAQLRGLPLPVAEGRIEALLDGLELRARADVACGAYSFGMKRKLALAGALLHEPRVLVLDEPLNGLDPRTARRLKDMLRERAAGGAAILLSTHDLATAETLCHRVGILHAGRLLAEGPAADLRALAAAPDLEALFLSLTEEAMGEASYV